MSTVVSLYLGRAVHAALPGGGAQAVARVDVIAVPAAPLPPDEAARRAAAQPGAFWLSAPAADEVGVARDLVGAAPVRVVRGDSAGGSGALEQAWAEARAAWGASGAAPPAGVPAAVGWFSYDLGRAFSRLAGARRRRAGTAWPLVEVHFHDAVWVREAGGARDDLRAGRGGGGGGWRTLLARPAPRPRRSALGPLDAPITRTACFSRGVERILEYLRAGDAYQVNLARRLSARCAPGGEAPVALAAALRARAPAPHAALIASADGDGLRWSATRPSGSWRVARRRRASRPGRSRGRARAAHARRRIARRRPRWRRRRRTAPSTS